MPRRCSNRPAGKPRACTRAGQGCFALLSGIRIVPENAEVQQEFDDFRLFCLQRLVARCRDVVKGEPTDAKTLDRFTYMIDDSVTSISSIAPTRPIYTRTLHDLAMQWLDVAGTLKTEAISPETAAKFGSFLGQIYLPNMLPGKPAPDSPMALFYRALKHPHPIVRLYSGPHHRRLMV